ATSVSGFRSGVDRRDYIGLRIVRRLETLGGSIRSPGGSRLAGTCLHPSVAFPFAVSDGTVCGRGPSGVAGSGEPIGDRGGGAGGLGGGPGVCHREDRLGTGGGRGSAALYPGGALPGR